MMMKNLFSLSFVLFLFCTAAQAQLKYYDASDLPLYGKVTDAAESRYVRFPDSLKSVSRTPLWNLSRNSAGMAIRFSSDSPTIGVKWTNSMAYGMNHMTDTGVSGLDLYAMHEGRWRFVNCARAGRTDTEREVVIIENMEATEREYMLYLPLYNGIASLEIGVDPASSVNPPGIESPRRSKPVVFYGTSILQGACASRPGMAFTNIISRRLDRETINLGFSGNAHLDLEVAEIMATVDAGCYVLDFVPNSWKERIIENMERFYRIIRDKHPGIPIIFVEQPIYTHSLYDRKVASEIKEKNEALNTVYRKLKSDGEKDIHFIPSENMIGHDGEATIDGVHFTDLGMIRYADLVCPVIERLLAPGRPLSLRSGS